MQAQRLKSLPFWRESGADLAVVACSHAGGGASVFQQHERLLGDAGFEVLSVQLPGRESRIGESPVDDWSGGWLEPIADEVGAAIGGRDFAVLGHSFGAFIGLELADALARREQQSSLFVPCCMRSPYAPLRRPPIHRKPTPVLLEHLASLGGLPKEVMECAELMESILPAVRADLRLAETYRSRHIQLSCPVVAIRGASDDAVTATEVDAWGKCTSGAFRDVVVDGNHFAIHHDFQTVVSVLVDHFHRFQ